MQPFRLWRRRCQHPDVNDVILAMRTRSPIVAEARSQACGDRLRAMPAPSGGAAHSR